MHILKAQVFPFLCIYYTVYDMPDKRWYFVDNMCISSLRNAVKWMGSTLLVFFANNQVLKKTVACWHDVLHWLCRYTEPCWTCRNFCLSVPGFVCLGFINFRKMVKMALFTMGTTPKIAKNECLTQFYIDRLYVSWWYLMPVTFSQSFDCHAQMPAERRLFLCCRSTQIASIYMFFFQWLKFFLHPIWLYFQYILHVRYIVCKFQVIWTSIKQMRANIHLCKARTARVTHAFT